MVRVRITNRTGQTVGFVSLEPVLGSGLQAPATPPVGLGAHSQVTVDVEIKALAVGRWALHGFLATFQDGLGVFAWQAYYPRTEILEVRPAARASRRGLPDSPGILGLAGRTSRFAGPGDEFREIREYRPRDPFRRMAWRHTARTGRPMVREYYTPTSARYVLLLDSGASMRQGPTGATKLDAAIDYVARFAHQALSAGASVGFGAVDGVLHRFVPVRRGTRHLERILRELVVLQSPVEHRFTDPLSEEVLDLVASYVRLHDGIDPRIRRDAEGPGVLQGRRFKYSKLVFESWMSRCLQDLPRWALQEAHAPLDPDPFLARLRLCCLVRGIELPYRSGLLADVKRATLLAALGKAAELRTPAQVHVITDLLGAHVDWHVALAVSRARARGHELVAVIPYGPLLHRGDGSSSDLAQDLAEAEEAASTMGAAHTLRRLGTAVCLLDGSGRLRPLTRTRAVPAVRDMESPRSAAMAR